MPAKLIDVHSPQSDYLCFKDSYVQSRSSKIRKAAGFTNESNSRVDGQSFLLSLTGLILFKRSDFRIYIYL